MGGLPIDLRLVRTFIAVADERHFRRAADRLNATQSAVSLQVRELERRLGVALLLRDRRSVTLTPAGQALRSEGQALLERSEAVARNVVAAQDGRRDVISIGGVGAATFEVLPKLIEVTRKHAPSLQYRFFEMSALSQLEALRVGDIDIGLVRSELKAPGLAFKTIQVEPVVCLLPTGHPLECRSEIRIPELENEPIINLSREHDPAGHDFYISIYRAAGFEPQIIQEASQATAILFAVSTLRCLGLGPRGWRVLKRDGVVIRPVAEPMPMITTRLVWKPSNLKPGVRAILEAAAEIAPCLL